jgi:Berberine and berberine like
MVTAAPAARISQLRKSSRMTSRFVQIAIASVGRANGHDAAKSLQTIVRGEGRICRVAPRSPVKGAVTVMSSIAEAIDRAARSFMGQLVQRADETERGIAWARDTFSALTPYLAPTRYLNYLEDDAVDPAAVAYGPNLRRLRELKTKWDPDNFFRRNVNILPRSGDAI